MAILSSRPSRSYATVDHNPEGMAPVGSAPYTRKDGFKTYRPCELRFGQEFMDPPTQLTTSHLALAETHLKRSAYDSNPDATFSPLPPSFNLTRSQRKDQAIAGQRAELDHILQPEYKLEDGASVHTTTAGPSRSRTAGGLTAHSVLADRKGKSRAAAGLALRSSPSMNSFKAVPNSANSHASGNGGRSSVGIYVDADGKVHDTEFDPFAGVSEMSRKKSRRRSAFGTDRRKGSGSSSSGSSISGSEKSLGARDSSPRKSMDGGGDEDEIRRRLELERRRLDEVSGLAAARRKSMLSDRGSIRDGVGNGKTSPSIRSSDDGFSSAQSYLDRAGRSKSQQGYYVPSPLSPTFSAQNQLQARGGQSLRATASSAALTSSASINDIIEESPQKTTERTNGHTSIHRHQSHQHIKEKTPVSVSVTGDKIKVTGFDAPVSHPDPSTGAPNRATSPRPADTPNGLSNHFETLRIPASAADYRSSRGSTDSARPPKPAERPREDTFPETPAQIKKREERERERRYQGVRAGAGGLHRITSGTPGRHLGVDTQLSNSRSGSGRILPEIEIVEDDDPRIVFPDHGKATRVQTKHGQADHVIKGPFSMALQAQAGPSSSSAIGVGYPGEGSGKRYSSDVYSTRSAGGMGAGSGKPASIAPSTIIDSGAGGYLPSRWASGDRELRTTEDAKEKYRPREWGGKTGDLGGKPEEWK